MTVEASGMESLMWAAGAIGFFALLLRKGAKVSDERNPELNRPYVMSDKGWTDEHNRLNYRTTDFNILSRGDDGEYQLIYKGAITEDDSRTPRYTAQDIDYVDQYNSIHFKDGFVLDQSSISTKYHKYFDIQNQYPVFSREWEAAKMTVINGMPSLSQIQRYDIVDIRHENKGEDYLIFSKGSCPSKHKKNLVTGITAKGPITKEVLRSYEYWGMTVPPLLTEDPPNSFKSFPWED